MKLLLGTTGLLAAASCCCGLDSQLGGSGLAPPSGQTRYVVATPSLTLRAAPSKDAAEIEDIARGEAVVVTGTAEGYEVAAGIHGGWAPVWHSGQQGFAFDGFLFPWRPAPPGCAGLDGWAASLEHVGAALNTESPQCHNPDMEVECSKDTQIALVDGAWFHQNTGWEWGSETLHFPDVGRDVVWAAARACFTSQPDLHLQPLPTQAGPVPTLSSDMGDVTATVESDKVGWEWGDGCSGYVYVIGIGADTEIISGGGC